MIVTYLESHALVVLASIASLVMAIRIVGSRRASQSVNAWLLALVFMPFVAIPLYLVIGSRKFPRRAKTSHEAAQIAIALTPDDPMGSIARCSTWSGVAPPRQGNGFELLSTGEAAYTRLLGLIADARRSIDLTMFILGDDATGRALVLALAERAQHGVDVRVILDAVGSARSRRRATAALAEVGAEVRSFMPLRHSPIRGRTNLRSHRKLGIFDDLHVFAGGMNLADEYMGPPLPPGRAPRWRDVAAVASGPVAIDAAALFESDWLYCGGARRPPDAGTRTMSGTGGAELIQVVPSGPDMPTDTIYDMFLTGIFRARERIVIVTPYYIPDELLQHALVLSARRGVRTELVIPSRSNHRIADVARRTLVRELAAAGVVVHYYAKGMVHAKAMVIDDVFAYIGSPNFDMRSLFLNYENALCVYSPAAIAQIRGFVDGLIAECVDAGPPARARWVTEQVARLLAPEL